MAKKHLKKVATAAPVNQHYHYLLGFTYSVKEQWAKAVRAFLKAISLDPDNGKYERGVALVEI